MLRTLAVSPFALIIILLFFYGLAHLSSMGVNTNPTKIVVPQFDFLTVRPDTEPDSLDRKRPEIQKQVKPQNPSLSKITPEMTFEIEPPIPNIVIPNIDVGININLAPTLHHLPAPSMEMAFDSNPTIISRIPPQYPRRAMRKKTEGSVTIEFEVTKIGSVKPGSIKIIESSPQGVFDKAVLRSILRWRFKPRLSNGKAGAFLARQTLDFRLKK